MIPSSIARHRTARGFTLIEVMITVAIVAILATIAIPSYRDYILRGNLADAPTALATVAAQMERYYQDNRTYASVGGLTTPCAALVAGNPAPTRKFNNFQVNCIGVLDGSNFTITAVGEGPVANFAYTINNNQVRTTASVAPGSGYVTCATKWILRKGDPC